MSTRWSTEQLNDLHVLPSRLAQTSSRSLSAVEGSLWTEDASGIRVRL